MKITMLILTFFAIYGVVQLLAKGLFAIRRNHDPGSVFSHRLLAVRDCEESAEGMIRTLFFEDIREPLIVLDLGSHDRTGEILEKLREDYDFLLMMKPEEYQTYLKDMAENPV